MHSLNIQRIGLLLRRQFLLHARSAYAILLPALLIFIFAVLTTAFDEGSQAGNPPFYLIWYGIFICIIGFIGTTKAIPEFTSSDGRQSFLTLPASNTEKWVAAYLYTGPIFFLVFSLGFWLLTLLTSAVLGTAGYEPYQALQLFTEDSWALAKGYFLVIHPVALLGGIVFNRFAAAKTIGVNLVVLLLVAAVALLSVRIVFRDHFTGFFTQVNGHGFNANFDPTNADWFPVVMLVLTGLLLVASYFRLHEKEV